MVTRAYLVLWGFTVVNRHSPPFFCLHAEQGTAIHRAAWFTVARDMDLREFQEMERLLTPWLIILLGTNVTVFAVQGFITAFNIRNRVRVCCFLAWSAHTLPDRLSLLYRAERQPGQMDHTAPVLSRTLPHKLGTVVMTVSAFVASVPLCMDHSLASTVLVLACATVGKHAYQSLVWRWPSVGYQCLDVAIKSWISVVTYVTVVALFVFMEPKSGATPSPRHWVLGGLVWPAVRHAVRWSLASLMVDPHGSRGTVRVYTSLAVDLPLFIMSYSQTNLTTVAALIISVTVVDVVISILLASRDKSTLFAVSNLPWVQIIAILFVPTLQPGTTMVELLQRLWFGVMYLTVIGTLPGLLVRWHPRCRMRDIPYEKLTDQTEEPVVATAWWRQTWHTPAEQVERDPELDFSDAAIPTSRHVLRLVEVVAQADSICLCLQGMYYLRFLN